MMGKRPWFILGVLLLVLAASAEAQEVRRVKMPELKKYIEAADHPVLISFWATWCLPCEHEIPWLEAAIRRHAAEKPELVLVSLDFTSSYPQKIRDFIRAHRINASFFWLDENNPDDFCPYFDKRWRGGIPANYFFNPSTRYRKFFNRQLTELQAEAEVRKLISH